MNRTFVAFKVSILASVYVCAIYYWIGWTQWDIAKHEDVGMKY
ncbi:hypothetical protein [Microbulbifer sp. JMSA002]